MRPSVQMAEVLNARQQRAGAGWRPDSAAAGFSGTPGDIFLATGCSLLSSAARFTAAAATSPALVILTGIEGLPLSLPHRSMALTISMPSMTLPNTTCLLLR